MSGGSFKMIRLYRYDGLEFLLNVDLISQVEATPDTVITLLSGEKIRVKNNIIDVTTKIKACRLGIEAENRDLDEMPENSERSRKFPRH
jgi:flagellar protein FlbD